MDNKKFEGFEVLDDEVLDMISGGTSDNPNQITYNHYCSECGKNQPHRLASGARLYCKVCGKQN